MARTVKRAAKRAHVVAGAGSNSTLEAIHLSREAEQSGADAVMLVVPYYNRPTQDGLVAHYVAVAREVACPSSSTTSPAAAASICCRTRSDGSSTFRPTSWRSRRRPAGRGARAQELVRPFGAGLTVLSGDDALTLPMLAVGAEAVCGRVFNLTLQGAMSELAKTLKDLNLHIKANLATDCYHIRDHRDCLKFAFTS